MKQNDNYSELYNTFVSIAIFDLLSQNTKNKLEIPNKFSSEYNKNNRNFVTNLVKVACESLYMIIDNNVISIKADWIEKFVEDIQKQEYTVSQIGEIHDNHCKNCYEFLSRNYSDSDNFKNNSLDF